MKKLILSLVVFTTFNSYSANKVNSYIHTLDSLSVQEASIKGMQHIVIVKWKNKSTHQSLLMTPETRALENKTVASARTKRVSRTQGLEALSSVYSKSGLALKHIRTSSLDYDVLVTNSDSQSQSVVNSLIKTGYFETVHIDFKVNPHGKPEFQPLNIRVGTNALDKDKFNDPAYVLASYLDEQQEGALGNHSILKANDYIAQNKVLDRKVRIAIVDTGFWDHEDVDYSKDDGADFVTTFGFDRYEDCSATDVNNTGADVTCAIENYKDDIRDMDPTDKSWDFQKDSDGNPTAVGQICIDGHGLNVASTITSIRNNNLGLVAATDNNDITVVPVRALGCDGGYSANSADAIVWASGGEVPGMPNISEKVDVINLSLSGFAGFLCDERSLYKDAVAFAQSQGVVVVASSGNAFEDVSQWQPASCDGVLSVSSNDKRGELSSSSNYGDQIDITFTGEDISVAIINQSIYADPSANSSLCSLDGDIATVSSCYGKTSGTSFSSPLAAASIAMIKMVKPELDENELRALLSSTATPYNEDGLGNQTLRSTLVKNAGIGNVYKAITTDLDFSTIENLDATHAFNDFESAVDSAYLRSLSDITSQINVCNTYELSWGNYRDAVTNVDYFLYGSSSADSDLNFDNSTLLTPASQNTRAIVNLSTYTRIGVLSTVNGTASTIFEFDLSEAQKPSFCI